MAPQWLPVRANGRTDGRAENKSVVFMFGPVTRLAEPTSRSTKGILRNTGEYHGILGNTMKYWGTYIKDMGGTVKFMDVLP